MNKELIYIIGGGTLCNFIIDIINEIPKYQIAGIFDDNFPQLNEVAGIKVIGRFNDIDLNPSRNLVIGIGEPKFRKTFYKEKKKKGFIFPSVIHPQTVISANSKIHDGVIIGPYTTVLSNTEIGAGTCVLSHVNINHNISIAQFVLIGASVSIGNGAKIGEGAHISMGKIIAPQKEINPWEYFK
ncbi:MAG: hypothetical protein V1781_02975 [Bacteroidota bacterium]